VAAGAGAAIALAPLTPAASSAPVAQTLDVADPAALQAALDDLTKQTAALTSELDATRKRLAAQQAAAQAAQAAARPAAPAGSGAPPAVHARTGASGGGGEHEGKEHGND
jgi:peptidoglycan hydrolase CwlO-like protein